ncbi:MAG TPA: hypothetical protein VJT49_16820 [Amycolatopsis sp.]|uniref:hypothetical protein n=1 Tax=Amycolatopsis sp. TaxID=37632 RepID=UPI002B45F6D6|nr:hypothetical protein [Amycolatopsis sp.]HKS46737.1 hypothetical protein [Amycolatopsis sp.]
MIGNAKFADITRHVWWDLTAGNGVAEYDAPWRTSCSPGILANHAAKARKPVDILLYEIQVGTYDRLLGELGNNLPTLGYEKDGEDRWVLDDRVRLRAVNASGHTADTSILRPSDAVLVFNDPNAITEWAMRPSFAQEVTNRGVGLFRSLSTLGCNAAGIKRGDLEDGSGDAKRERRAWFELIAAQQASLPAYRDLFLAGIERDAAQWAYLLCTAQTWWGKTEAIFRTEFAKINRTTTMDWYRRDPARFEAAKRFLFLTRRERELGVE